MSKKVINLFERKKYCATDFPIHYWFRLRKEDGVFAIEVYKSEQPFYDNNGIYKQYFPDIDLSFNSYMGKDRKVDFVYYTNTNEDLEDDFVVDIGLFEDDILDENYLMYLRRELLRFLRSIESDASQLLDLKYSKFVLDLSISLGSICLVLDVAIETLDHEDFQYMKNWVVKYE